MNADRILRIQDGATRPLVSRPKFSSVSVPWAGFLFEECVVPMEINRHLAVDKPTICLCTSGKGVTHWRCNGVHDRYSIVNGSVCVWRRDYELETSWVSNSWDIVVLALDAAKFRHHAPLEAKAVETSLVGFRFSDDPTVARLVSEMHVEAKAGCPSGALYAQSLSLALLSYLSARYADAPPANGPNGGLSPVQRRRVLRLIKDNLGAEVTVSGLADSIGVSSSYFFRAFKASFGMTPHHFVMRERIAQAKQLLTVSDWSVAYISAELGFSSHSHFTRLFHKHIGVTPKQFRSGL